MDDDLSFGRWVKVRRVALGLTQAQLAARTGYSRATIRKIESDDLRPSGQIIDKLVEGLGLAGEERSAFIHRARAEAGAAHHRHFLPESGRQIPSPIAPPAARRPPAPLGSTIANSKVSLPPFLTEQATPVTPPALFVGRVRELAELAASLETAASSKGQLLFVIGDAGRGKTALVQEFARQAQRDDADLLAVSGHCSAYTGMGDPYLPFRELLATLVSDVEAKWVSGSLSTESARRLWEAMPITVPALVEHAPDLIGPFVPAKALQSHAAAFLPPDAGWVQQLGQRTDNDPRMHLEERRLFGQVTAVLKAIAARRPLLLILEDLHWIDAASSSLLFHLSRAIGDSSILLIGTYRPDELIGQGPERHPLLNITKELKRQHGDIWLDLGDLSALESRQFVDAYLDTQPNRLGEAFRAAFFRHTGGHALFSAEILHEMQARGDLCRDADGSWIEGGRIDWRTLPARVEGVIEARVDRLDPLLQALLTVASVEGEVFTAEVVARVQQRPEREVVQRLGSELDRQQRLVTAEALYQTGQQRLSRYRFRHYLFQHYLYHRLDSAERAYLHEGIGSALESLYGEQTEPVAVQLAHHYEQAGVTEKAVNYLLQAGERAQRLSAYQEAIQHLTRGLALLPVLPDTPQRARQELALQVILGQALAANKGPAAPETGTAYNRAHELSVQTGEVPKLFAALYGLWAYHRVRAELQVARAVAEQMLHLAQNQPDPILRVSAHRALGSTLFFLGELGAAREHFDQALILYQPQNHLSYVLLFGLDDGALSLANLAWTLWLLGYPDQALQRGHEALALAQTLAHPLTLYTVLLGVTMFHLSRRDEQVVQQQAEVAISLAAEHELISRGASWTFFRGLAWVRQGKQEGIEQMESGWNVYHATGAKQVESYFLAGLAEGYASVGETGQALHLLAEALAVADKDGNRFWEAELYRLKGELLLMQAGDTQSTSPAPFTEVEACFHQAIEVARRQQAKSLELRATTRLCRLWQAQGKNSEAHTLLAEIYNWFTEGFDTADLLEAKALLETLK